MLPPSIPTSFVPHAPAADTRRGSIGSSGVFSFLSYFILAIVVTLAIGVFFYAQILASDESAKSGKLAQAEAAINPATVQSFVRLRDRLNSGQKLLAGHTAFSGFFTLLDGLTPTTVRFSSLNLSSEDAGTIKLDGSGVAKNFNALAAASLIFAKNEQVKNAIFSNIKMNAKDNSVSFSFAATLDPKVVAFSPSAPVIAPNMSASSTFAFPVATSTPKQATSTPPKATSTKPTL
jgi:hypothetical protein